MKPGGLDIADHGVIGDRRSIALVGTDGTIDFLCYPSFDSPSVFASLLDDERGGSFAVYPELPDARRQQFYLPNTNVLLTRFLAEEAVAELSDFMPVGDRWAPRDSVIVRQARAVRGEITFRLRLQPAFDYGRAQHRVHRDGKHLIFESRAGDGLALRLRSSHPLKIDGAAGIAELDLAAGETATFVLERASEENDSPFDSASAVEEAFADTVHFWRRWISRSTYQGRWRDRVHRSALLLKLLQHHDSGSLIAAPTFGLPEEIGGMRNWDYRYTWLRDASFTVQALSQLGIVEESHRFMEWLEQRCLEVDPGQPLAVLYTTAGGTCVKEETLDHFRGYRGSTPVRIGNAAAGQLQLDIYGELFDALWQYSAQGFCQYHQVWSRLEEIINWVCDNWRREDEGVWETRGGRHEFVQSRLMCWVALDRALKLADRESKPAPRQRWLETRDAIYHDLHARFWNEQLGAFMQYPGANRLDAGCLLMPLVGFISPTDPRWLSTLRRVEDELAVDELVYRYRAHDREEWSDGLEGQEGTFSICTFWLVQCLARAGELDRAQLAFEKMLAYGNHVGLYAEQLGRRAEHLGNFPQALTHLGLINAAIDLDARLNASRSPMEEAHRRPSVEMR